jgi:hypothetical protein
MAIFALWLLFWVAGGVFGPVQYHPTAPLAPGTYHNSEHDSGSTR